MKKMIVINFEKEAKKRREKNQLELKYSIAHLDKNKNLKEKIENYAERYGLSINYVIDKLNNAEDDMIFNGFEKDPGRQNIYEILQLEFIQKISNYTGLIQNVKKLKSGGKDANYIKNGKIIMNLTKSERADLKSLDFYREYMFKGNKLQFYTTCKYTQDEGGAQDNQANDVYNTFMESVNMKDKNIFFIALVDGEYYNKKKWGGKNFYDYLNEIFTNGFSSCTDCSNLFNVIKNNIIVRLRNTNYDKNEINLEISRIDKMFLPNAM